MISLCSDMPVSGVASDLLRDLNERAVEVQVVAGRLHIRPASRLTDTDREVLRQHRDDLAVLALCRDPRTCDRVAGLRARRLPRPGRPQPGACVVCNDPLPTDRARARCSWCSLACRIVAGTSIRASVLDLFTDGSAGGWLLT